MPEKLISGDNHIDLTYLPPDLWSSEAPNKWKLLAPRVEEMDDGLHWFVDAQDRGMWNGIGPGFLPYQKGMFGHIDEMKDLGFEWNSQPGAKPRPTTPELRLADLDRDGLSAEIIYGCLMINDLIGDAGLRTWADKTYNDWVADFAKRSDPNRVFPLAIVPNTDPLEAAAEGKKAVVLFVDTFNGTFESENALAAARVLATAGYLVHTVAKHGGHYCCGRTYLSCGMVERAKALIADPNYPSSDTLSAVSGLLASALTSDNP